MHIVALEQCPNSQRGGQQLCYLELCRHLAKRTHEITLLYGQTGDLIKQYQTFCRRLIFAPSFTLIDHIFISFAQLCQRFINSSLQLPRNLYQISQQLRQSQPSIIYCNHVYDSLSLVLLAGLYRIPLVCHLHNSPIPPASWGSFPRLTMPHVSRLIEHFIAVSEHTRQEWIDFGIPAHKISTIFNGIDVDRFQPIPTARADILQQYQLPPNAQILLYAGRLDRQKGVDILLEAFAQLRPHHPHLHLLLAGKALLDGANYPAELHQQAQQLKLNNHVHFLGHIVDLCPLYSAAELFICPSTAHEAFGCVIIEAMACGTPVVASHVGGIPEILTDQFAQGLCPPNQAQELASAIDRLLNWRTTNPTLGQQCRQHVLEKFTLPQVAQQLEATMLQAIQKSATKQKSNSG
jgi:glycosyltransferase involved in cell wall biosynthesis